MFIYCRFKHSIADGTKLLQSKQTSYHTAQVSVIVFPLMFTASENVSRNFQEITKYIFYIMNRYFVRLVGFSTKYVKLCLISS